MICEKCATDGRCHEGCVCCARLARAENAERSLTEHHTSLCHMTALYEERVAELRECKARAEAAETKVAGCCGCLLRDGQFLHVCRMHLERELRQTGTIETLRERDELAAMVGEMRLFLSHVTNTKWCGDPSCSFCNTVSGGVDGARNRIHTLLCDPLPAAFYRLRARIGAEVWGEASAICAETGSGDVAAMMSLVQRFAGRAVAARKRAEGVEEGPSASALTAGDPAPPSTDHIRP